MKPNLLKYAMADVPRYTSYPTAVQFDSAFEPETLSGWLHGLSAPAGLSAYVHVPFCHQLCWYCGCSTSVPNTYDRAKRYAGTLVREITQCADRIGLRAGAIEHLHFGGGTPTYLDNRELETIVSAIDDRLGLSPDGERAIEIDPRSFDDSKAAALSQLGFNRVSLGVQDFDAAVQAKINRIQPAEKVAQVVEDLRRHNIYAINFDLMYGLPGQTLESVKRTARLAARMRPSRIAVFGYAHVPWFAKHQKMIKDADLPGVNERYDQALATEDALCSAGYIAIGMDHYALPDDTLVQALNNRTLRRNFQGYSSDVCDAVLGFGASSISSLPQGFAQNAHDTLSWSNAVEAGEFPVRRGLVLAPDDRLRGDIIQELMCYSNCDVEDICNRRGVSADRFDGAFEKLHQLEADGLVSISGRQVTVNPQNRLLVRVVATAFDAYLQPQKNQHAKAV